MELFCRRKFGPRSRALAKVVSGYGRDKGQRIWPEFTRPEGFPAGGCPLCRTALAVPPVRPSPSSSRIASPSEKQNRFHLTMKGSPFLLASSAGPHQLQRMCERQRTACVTVKRLPASPVKADADTRSHWLN